MASQSHHNLPPPVPYTRLNVEDAVIIAVDYQEGLFNLARDILPAKLKSGLLCHASLATLFNIPIILTTTDDKGPNGPIIREIREMHPDAPFVRRIGEVNAFDNPEFRDALKATGRKQVVIGALLTEVCATFLALSLRAEGYDVWANLQGSASAEKEISDHAYARMRDAGVHVLDSLAISMEMMRDWRNTPGAAEVLPWMDKYVPSYGSLARAHLAAVSKAKEENEE
ncbi:Isochorismatase [Fusarium austroafricanum]|uniref:Isochorismatase n=1 Tax=Fusarium austroafricanum TaxID=2364996 RepID=A0A8H4KMU7_9HYPO|nr:Isochorismatase [Fusarium austroafricanum]